MSNSASTNTRLSIDTQIYRDGDPEFKTALLSLMIKDIRELRSAIVSTEDSGELDKTMHKIKSTIHMLNNKGLISSLQVLTCGNFGGTSASQAKGEACNQCDKIIVILEEEVAELNG
jgi:hypothetical protein